LSANGTVMVVDDDASIRELASLYLRKEGYDVTAVADGDAALAAIGGAQPSLIVLDIMLPGLSGYDVCKRLRAESDIPIIMLTARDDDVDKIVGLGLGADDYLTKPFNPRELVARVKAVLRRAEGKAPRPASAVSVGGLRVDKQRREAHAGDRELTLRTKEFDLLAALAENAGIVLSREQLLDRVWGYSFYGETRTVDVHVQHLRAKIAGAGVSIATVRGVGYKLVED
jgi:DNA-binding response OmpR family regulator